MNKKNGKSRKKRRVWWALPVTLAAVAVMAGVAFYVAAWAAEYPAYSRMRAAVERDTFYAGLSVAGEDVSGMTLAQAVDTWGQRDAQNRAAHRVTLSVDGDKMSLDADKLGYRSDYREVLASAWAVGRYGTLEQRYKTVSATAGDWRQDYAVTAGYDEGALRDILTALEEKYSVGATNAKVTGFDAGSRSFTFTEAKSGYAVDTDEVRRDIDAAIRSGGGTVTVARRAVDPKNSAEQLKETYGEISTATTNASTSSKNRLTNLRLACAALNGMRIDPGDTFSFNKALGKRTTEKGYKSAGAIENGLTTEQVGGGICQVSTTLFNAVVKANMKIVERSPHSRPSSYIDPGKDAAVNWPNQDFKFKNNSSGPVYLAAEVTSKKRVVVSVYGKRLENGMTIKLESRKTAELSPGGDKVTYDARLATGQRVVVEAARKGYKATTYKVYYDKFDSEIKREELCKSTYPASGAVVRVGP